MKCLLLILLITSMMLCGCANTSVMSDNSEEKVSNETTPTIAEEALASDIEPSETAAANTPQESITDVTTSTTATSKKTAFPNPSELWKRPDGKEVSIFKDNTFDCDYSGYKEIGYDFGTLHRSVMVPQSWNGYRFYREDDPNFENMLTGTPIYDGPLLVEIDPTDDSTLFANEPSVESTFFFAESPWIHPEDYINYDGTIIKYDYETYVDKKGRSMKVYFLDGLPKYAVYDDFFFLCIWFNLDSEEQIPIVVNMINSIEVSLSREAEFTLKTAERLGYTIIPPEE